MFDELVRVGWVLHVQEVQVAVAGSHGDFRFYKGWVASDGIVEIGDGRVQIVFLFWLGNIVIETVDGTAPECKATPVVEARDQQFILSRRSQFGMEALESRAISFI